MTKQTRDELLISALSKNFPSVSEQLNHLLNEAVKMTGSGCGFIYFYDKEKDEFTLFSRCAPKGPDYIEECGLDGNIGILRNVIKTAVPVVINDFSQLHPDAIVPYQNAMFVPTASVGGDVAVFGFAGKCARYTPGDVNAVRILTSGVWHDIERKEREAKLMSAVENLKTGETRLQQILNSVSDAIFGFDNNVICTFCNKSALRLLGLGHENDLVGKDVREVLKPNFVHKTSCDYKIAKVIQEGIIATSEKDEIFYRPDGSTFYIEYNSYPQFYEGKVVGAVVSFSDITDHVIREKELLLSSYLDVLTGIYNRRYFEIESVRLDAPENYPLSIIIGDINGLKIVNDIFGHQAGDKLLQKAAEILNEHRRPKDIPARWGGDEFIMMLPNTAYEEAVVIAGAIKDKFSSEKIHGLSCTISWGCSTKTGGKIGIAALINKADELMYIEKTLNSRSFNYSAIKSILNILFERSPYIKYHSERVRDICEQFGRWIGLSKSEHQRLVEAAYFHDIGKIIPVDPDEFDFKKHPVVGFRILNNSADTAQLAKYVLSHHEYWNGTGSPKGLKGEEIPRLSRIISIAEYYDAVTAVYSRQVNKEEALHSISKKAGIIFDPVLAHRFIEMMQSDVHKKN